MNAPQTKYAKTDDGVYLAYLVAGEGPPDLAFQHDFLSNLEDEWEEPHNAALNRSLAAFSRLILHDRRGVGLSSRSVPPAEPRDSRR